MNTLKDTCIAYVSLHLSHYQLGLGQLPEELLLLIIQHLQLLNQLTEENLVYLLCPQLMSLCISRRPLLGDEPQITDSIFRNLSYQCPNLIHFRLEENHEIMGSSIKQLLRVCTNLQSLELLGYCQISDIIDRCIPSAGCQLKKLTLVNCKSISNLNMLLLAQQCGPTLESLNLKGCPQISEGTLMGMLRHTTRLQYLNLADGENTTDTVIKTIASKCPLITSLNLSWCDLITDASVLDICRSLTSLVVLKLRKCSLLTDVALIKIAETYNTRMETLDVQRCDQMTDEAVKALSLHCTGLTKLYLSWIPSISDSSVASLLRTCVRLRVLRLEGCKLLTFGAIDHLLDCPCGRTLQTLDLSWCDSFSKASLRSLATRLHKDRAKQENSKLVSTIQIIDYYRDIVDVECTV